MFDQAKLDFYIDNELNVLFEGRHGVGKTAIVKEAFERHNLKWKYFSAATMDPWVDFVGVPKESVDPETGINYIELVRPKGFHNDEVEAIFMDELNRSKEKVRNAVMELIQFKSINGVKFNNLKMVWAAINPEADEDADMKYDVEILDPAQKDRFHILVNIPYEPSLAYFNKRFSTAGVGAVEWWRGLTPDENRLVSPRRLEYAIEIFNKGGDLRDVLPNKELNLNQLRQRIAHGSIKVKLAHLYDENDAELCNKEFSFINFTTDAVPMILNDTKYIERFAEFLPKDIISKLITENDGEHVEAMIRNTPAEVISPILASLIASNTMKRTLLQKVIAYAEERGLDLTSQNAFRTAIEESLGEVSKSKADRYNALHSINKNFNSKATLETYEMCITFLARMIYHTQDNSLKDPKKPSNQLGVHIMGKLEPSLTEHKTSVMEVYKRLKPSLFTKTDDDRLDRIEEYFNSFISAAKKDKK